MEFLRHFLHSIFKKKQKQKQKQENEDRELKNSDSSINSPSVKDKKDVKSSKSFDDNTNYPLW